MPPLIHTHTAWRGVSMRLAADATGLLALLLGNEKGTLAELRKRFPNSRLRSAHLPAFDAALAHLEDPEAPLPLLAPIGTPFQQSVWSALRQIPRGHTTHYAALASTLGRPRAARAIAAACAANPIAILIPCHRVIRRDGAISGYRWGVETKQKILAMENHPAHLPPALNIFCPTCDKKC